MEKEFVPYGLASRLKALGFDERCFRYESVKKICENQAQPGGCQLPNVHCAYPKCTIDSSVESLPIPTWQQAFRWFREKYGLSGWVNESFGGGLRQGVISIKSEIGSEFYPATTKLFYTYEEAELACLEKLIEIVENNK